MADIAQSVADFEQNIKFPANDLETIADQKSVSIPSGFITLYQHIVSLISLYQSAFEEENFNRMAQYVIAINRALISYFEKEDKTQEVKKRLAEIENSLKDSVKKLIKEKSAKPLSKDDLKNEVFGIVEGYKNKIIDSLQAFALVYKNAEDKKPDGSSKAEPMKYAPIKLDQVKKIPEATVKSANVILMRKQIEFNKSLKKFSVSLGGDIISKFKGIASKLTFDNLKRFNKNLAKLDHDYNATFSTIIYNNSKKVKEAAEAIKKSIGYKLKNVLKIGLNVLTITLTAGFGLYYMVRTMKRIVFFWGAKLLGIVGNVLNFTKRLVVGAIKTAINVVSGIVSTAYKGVTLITKGAAAIVAAPFKLSKILHDKIVKLSGISIGSLFGAFFMSYPGAYFLGYMSGRIWRLVLKSLGISDESIRNGDYSVKDDVLMPFIEDIKKKFEEKKKIIDTIKNFTKGEDLSNLKEKVLDSLNQNQTFQNFKNGYEAIKDFWENQEIDVAINTIKFFYQDTLSPILHTLWSVVSAVAEGYIEAPETVSSIHYGLGVGLDTITKWGLRTKAAGGWPGIIVGLLTAGAAAMIGQMGNAKNNKDNQYPIYLPISAKYANLYGNSSEQSRFESASVTLSNFRSKRKKENETDNIKYRFIEKEYRALLDEEMELLGYEEAIKNLEDTIDSNSQESVANTKMAKNILYYNGQPILSEPLSSIKGTRLQLKILKEVVSARLLMVKQKIDKIDALSKSKESKTIEDAYKEFVDRQLYLPEGFILESSYAELRGRRGIQLGSNFISIYSNLNLKESGDGNTNQYEIEKDADASSAYSRGLALSLKLFDSPPKRIQGALNRIQEKEEITAKNRRTNNDALEEYYVYTGGMGMGDSFSPSGSSGFNDSLLLNANRRMAAAETKADIAHDSFDSDWRTKYIPGILNDLIIKNISGMVAVFFELFCKKLFPNNLFKELNDEQENLQKLLDRFNAAYILNLNRLNGSQDISKIANAKDNNEAFKLMLDAANDIFWSSLESVSEAFKKSQDATDIQKMLEEEIKKQDKSTIRTSVENFFKEKTDLLAALKDLLDLAKPDKKEKK